MITMEKIDRPRTAANQRVTSGGKDTGQGLVAKGFQSAPPGEFTARKRAERLAAVQAPACPLFELRPYQRGSP
jgi:hypothetical protein